MQHLTRSSFLLALGTLAAMPATAQTLSQARQTTSPVTVDDVALFAGGRFGGTLSLVVDAYDDTTGLWSVGSLSVPRSDIAATAVGSLALFAGGSTSGTTSTDVVDIYDASVGPPSNPAAWSVHQLSIPRFGATATTIGTKALFAGGALGGPFNVTGVTDVVDVYDASVGPPTDAAAWSIMNLSVARGLTAAATVGTEAIFAGGLNPIGASDVVDIYDDSTGQWRATTLSEARSIGPNASVTVGSRAYFAGGQTLGIPPTFSDRVDVYDVQTGVWSTDSLSVARGLLAATAVGNSALFAGGTDGAVWFAVIDGLNVATGVWDSTASLSLARADLAATSVGGKALFAGGNSGTGATAAVDIVEPYLGQSYCGPAVANSTGSPSIIEASGSPLASANDVTLVASDLPASAFGFFLTSQSQGFTTNPGGSLGNLCLGGAIGRYVGAGQVKNSGAAGFFELPLDLDQMPTPTGLVAAQGGQTWHFQAWHRDSVGGNATSNFTDAVQLTLL